MRRISTFPPQMSVCSGVVQEGSLLLAYLGSRSSGGSGLLRTVLTEPSMHKTHNCVTVACFHLLLKPVDKTRVFTYMLVPSLVTRSPRRSREPSLTGLVYVPPVGNSLRLTSLPELSNSLWKQEAAREAALERRPKPEVLSRPRPLLT